MIDFEKQYTELVDALCSKSWLGRDRHASVLGLARRLRDSQEKLYPAIVGNCTRATGHPGPCNGFPNAYCPINKDRAK